MPQTDFFLDDADEEHVVRYILSRAAYFVPNFNDRATPTRIRDWRSYVSHREEKLYFIVSDSYLRYPLALHRVEGGYYEGKYAVTQRVGGPSIDFYCARPYEKDGIRWLGVSSIARYVTYEDSLTNTMESPPPALIEFYRDIVRELKVGAHLIEGKNRKYWIARQAYESAKTTSKLHVAGLPEVR